MKRVHRILLHLYPKAWRERYSHEFAALLEDTGAGWRQIPDILTEALQMRLATLNFRFIGACALAGLAIATVIAFRIPERYTATATLHVTPANPDFSGSALSEADLMVLDASSRTQLTNLILSPDLKLYDEERRTKRIEQVIAEMQENDLRLTTALDGTMTVSYRGKSPDAARATVERLISRITGQHLNRQQFLAHLAADKVLSVESIGHMKTQLVLLQPPSLPVRPSPDRAVIVLAGLLGGLLLAGLLTLMRIRTRVWLIASVAVALLSAVTFILPIPYECVTTVLFDSPATRAALASDPQRLIADAQTQAILIRVGRRNFWGIQSEPQAVRIAATIRTRHADPELARYLSQRAIISLIEAARAKQSLPKPTVEVLTAPTLASQPMGYVWREGILAVSLALMLLSGCLWLLEKRRPDLAVQPA